MFIQALQTRPAPLGPPPRFRSRISQPIPEDQAIAIFDHAVSPSSRIGSLPILRRPDEVALVGASPKAGPPPPPSTVGASSSNDAGDSDNSYTATHVSMDSLSVGTVEEIEDGWCHASRTADSDPLILDRDTEHFAINSEASVDSFASWYKE